MVNCWNYWKWISRCVKLKWKKFWLLFHFFFLVPNSFAENLSYEKLIELGYPRTFFYKDNYKKSNVKWFDLKEIVNQKPKFIALVEQNLKKDGNFEDYKFVYSSKHNFFKMITKEIDKKKNYNR